MYEDDVLDLVMLFAEHKLEVCLDGGWAVDALIGEQTRPHSDLDIALPHSQVPKLRKLLEARGYKDVPRDDTRDCNFILGDDEGRLVDVHSYTFDENGRNVFGVEYLPEHLTGQGVVATYPVQCIDPEWLVKFHSGYEIDENDYHDVRLLCDKYEIPLPPEYHRYE